MPSSLQEYISSGEYFNDAKKWYNNKYLAPLYQRSFLAAGSVVVLIIFALAVISITLLLPSKVKVNYLVYNPDYKMSRVSIINPEQFENAPEKSMALVLIKNYVEKRESYNFTDIDTQTSFVKSNSSPLVYEQFQHYIDINNPISPQLRFQKYAKRHINIDDTTVRSMTHDSIILNFTSTTKTLDGKIIENMIWEAEIAYNMTEPGEANKKLRNFSFQVTGYKLKLIKNKLGK